MNTFEIRQQITQSLENISPESLALVADFIESLQYKQHQATTETKTDSSETSPVKTTDTPTLSGTTLDDLLKFAGTWEGDDIRECLQLVHETRAQLEFTSPPYSLQPLAY